MQLAPPVLTIRLSPLDGTIHVVVTASRSRYPTRKINSPKKTHVEQYQAPAPREILLSQHIHTFLVQVLRFLSLSDNFPSLASDFERPTARPFFASRLVASC